MIHKFEIYGKVRGQGRPRLKRNGHTYKTKDDRDWEDKIKEAYINSNGGYFGKKPIIIAALIYRDMPKSRPKYRVSEMDVYKPDVDNILKGIADALNGIAYEDDRQIIAAFPIKMPRVKDRGEHIEVMISDEFSISTIEMNIRRFFQS